MRELEGMRWRSILTVIVQSSFNKRYFREHKCSKGSKGKPPMARAQLSDLARARRAICLGLAAG